MNLDLKPCVVEPGDEDWKSKDIAEVYLAAQAGVPEAVSELQRRR